MHAPQIASDTIQFLSSLIQKSNAKGTGTAHAAVIGGAAADGHRNIPVSSRQSILDQFAGPITAG